MHKALKQATKPPHSLIKYNPAEGATLPTVVRKEMKVLSDDEIPKLLESMKAHWHYAIYHTALFCGLRRGEVLGLRKENVDYENKCIDIVSQLQREKKKGGKLRLVPLKNNRPRRVYPCDAVFDVLKEYTKLREDMKNDAEDSWNDCGLLFVNTTGGPLDGDAVYKSFKTILKKADVTDIRMHDLRHTYATVSLANGVDVKTLQEDLGHYDPGFTLKQYGHATQKMKKAAGDRMNEYVKSLNSKTE